MKKMTRLIGSFSAAIVTSFMITACHDDDDDHSYSSNTPTTEQKVLIGEKIYHDTSLSIPPVMSCASCHSASTGFADPRGGAVSEGAIAGLHGNRNAPTVSYAAYVPPLTEFTDPDDEGGKDYMGGLFWDGRVNSLEEQAQGPLENHLEQNEPSDEAVVNAVRNAYYVDDFLRVYGKNALDDTNEAFKHITDAIATFERSDKVNKFSSKFDRQQAGEAEFTTQEALGFDLFRDPNKGNCSACHVLDTDNAAGKALFTDFTYDNIGIPKNTNSPFLALGPEENPDGYNYIDEGLKLTTGKDSDRGRFRVPTLRNIALTGPYGHNGYFQTLSDIIHFYNVKNDGSSFPVAEIPETENKEELGALGLTTEEEQAIEAFLRTLTDE